MSQVLHKSTPSSYLLVLEQPLLRGPVGQEVAQSIAECIYIYIV